MRVHFVVAKEYATLLSGLGGLRVGVDYPYWVGGRFNWAAQSYLNLRESIPETSIGLVPVPGVVNFAHCMTWKALGPRSGEYRVSVRADYGRLFDVDFEILQNPVVRTGARQAYLPYWPVPGIIPRDSSRDQVTTVGYAGRIENDNLAGALKAAAVSGHLAGLRLQVIEPQHWHDMRNIDLLLAVRSFNKNTYPHKPPSKLFNSWLSEIPLLAGFDSAYSAVGTPGVDYVRVSSERQLWAWVARLRDDREEYQRIVASGRKRQSAASRAAISQEWQRVLKGPISSDFERWSATGGYPRSYFALATADRARAAAAWIKRKITS